MASSLVALIAGHAKREVAFGAKGETRNMQSQTSRKRPCAAFGATSAAKHQQSKMQSQTAKKRSGVAAGATVKQMKISSSVTSFGVRAQKKRKLPTTGTDSIAVCVGSSAESSQQHFDKHAVKQAPQNTCLRCQYWSRRSEYHRYAPWLMERPVIKGGLWALGCQYCSWACDQRDARKQQLEERKKKIQEARKKRKRVDDSQAERFGKKQAESGKINALPLARCVAEAQPARREKWQDKPRRGAWASCSVRSAVHPSRMNNMLREHGGSFGHRRAIEIMQAERSGNPLARADKEKDSASRDVSGQVEDAVAGDSAVLKGKVPQCQDWLDAWVFATSTSSLNKEGACEEKRRSAVGENACNKMLIKRNIRKVRRKQLGIMAEVTKRRLRKELQGATSISVVPRRERNRKLQFQSLQVRLPSPLHPPSPSPPSWGGVCHPLPPLPISSPPYNPLFD